MRPPHFELCPECGYDLRGSRPDRCPECGCSFDEVLDEYRARLARTRRTLSRIDTVAVVIFAIVFVAILALCAVIFLEG